MLAKFSVTNFKNFKNKFTFDLSSPRGYNFNQNCIRNGIVSKSVIYGKNASGKTNLILGIFDLIGHLTDYNEGERHYRTYKHLENPEELFAKFEYEFHLNNDIINYSYEKSDKETIESEELFINSALIIKRELNNKNLLINIEELESFDNTLEDKKLSALKYINKNTKIRDINNDIARSFVNLFNFVENMLMFYSLGDNAFIGQSRSIKKNVFQEIVAQNQVKQFELFLKKFGFDFNLKISEDHDETPTLSILIGEKTVKYQTIASSGMKALGLFYFWYIHVDKLKLLVIDEFDAFYHHKLSTDILTELTKSGCQIIVTTHNTSVMTNEIMRPDCYFRINKESITPLSEISDIELRQAHNIEKIYRSGWFDE